MNSRRTPSWIQRLRTEIRVACGGVPSSPGAPVSSPSPSAHPIGEWLGSVRQPAGEFSPPIRPGRRAPFPDAFREHGNLLRTRVTRIKGARATLLH